MQNIRWRKLPTELKDSRQVNCAENWKRYFVNEVILIIIAEWLENNFIASNIELL